MRTIFKPLGRHKGKSSRRAARLPCYTAAMRRWLLSLLCLGLLAACAPRFQSDFTLLTVSDGGASFSTLIAPFYRDLALLDVRVDSFESFHYDGQDRGVPGRVVENFYAKNENFCELRSRYRTKDGKHVMVLATNDNLEIRGVVYDLSRQPRLTYGYFEGQVFNPLPTKRCRK